MRLQLLQQPLGLASHPLGNPHLRLANPHNQVLVSVSHLDNELASASLRNLIYLANHLRRRNLIRSESQHSQVPFRSPPQRPLASGNPPYPQLPNPRQRPLSARPPRLHLHSDSLPRSQATLSELE